MNFLYKDDSGYTFMDNENFEQITMDENAVGESKFYLVENLSVVILFYNDRPVSVDVPKAVNLKVTQTDPGIRGDTVTGGTKPATLETGLVVKVPLHINEGDLLRIDTQTGEYVSRVNN
jgi:elongation factor P